MLEFIPARHLIGGLRLEAHKAGSTRAPIRRGLRPRRIVLALEQHRGAPAVPIVEVGQYVRKGEAVGAPGAEPSAAVHASVSGWVRAIEDRQIVGPDGVASSSCIVIEADGEDAAAPPQPAAWPDGRAARLDWIRRGGIVGLGGAVFPSAAKLEAAEPCRMLIINGAECEPYISCDDSLMREAPGAIVAGALKLAEIVATSRVVVAIERDKPRAIEAMRAAIAAAGDERVKLAELPTVYPAGGERQLIELLTGEEVPAGCFPTGVGYVCHNVGTAYALERLAAHGEPLVSRVVTITGGALAEPQNVEVPIGTPIADVIEHCGGYAEPPARLICGGSMMGYALPDDALPVGKGTNCIVAATTAEIRTDPLEWECIRCGECARACPARLMPQELLVGARARDYEALAVFGLRDCIECGCCDVACPSQIRLTERFRDAKRAYALHERETALSRMAQERYEQRERRLAAGARPAGKLDDRLTRQLRDTDARRQEIKAALERAAAKRGGRDQAD